MRPTDVGLTNKFRTESVNDSSRHWDPFNKLEELGVKGVDILLSWMEFPDNTPKYNKKIYK